MLEYLRGIRFTCDLCGEREEVPESKGELPKGWGEVSVIKEQEIEESNMVCGFCRRRIKKFLTGLRSEVEVGSLVKIKKEEPEYDIEQSVETGGRGI